MVATSKLRGTMALIKYLNCRGYIMFGIVRLTAKEREERHKKAKIEKLESDLLAEMEIRQSSLQKSRDIQAQLESIKQEFS